MNNQHRPDESPLVRRILAYAVVAATVVPLLVVAALGVTLALVMAVVLGMSALGNVPGFVVGLLVFAAGYPAAMTAHELGHAAAARLFGWPVTTFRVGPVVLDARGVHWVRRANWLRGMIAADIAHPARWQTAVLVGAGPVTNLAGGSLLVVLFAAHLPPLVRGAAGAFAAHSLFIAAATLLPVREGGMDSDGRVLFKLLTCPNWRGPPNPGSGLR